MHKAIFLDRDGTLNVDVSYNVDPAKIVFLDYVIDKLKAFQQAGYLLFIITNQSGIGKGYYDLAEVHKLHDYMLAKLKLSGITITKIYICPHKPTDNCTCRKPQPFFIQQAEQEYAIDLKNSYMVGDKMSDVWCGMNAAVGHNFLLYDKNNINWQNTKPQKADSSLNYSIVNSWQEINIS